MIPHAAVLCLAPTLVTLKDQQGNLHTYEIESGYFRHPWTDAAVWFSCCRVLRVFATGPDHLTDTFLAVRRAIDKRWGLAEPVKIPQAEAVLPFELDHHDAAALLAGPLPERPRFRVNLICHRRRQVRARGQ